MEKIDARKLSTETQQQLRNQAIRLRISGKKYREISEITGISATTICTWYKAYLDGGKSAIQIKKRGRTEGSFRTLTQDQEKELQKVMRDKCPDQLKFPFALWTRKAVKQAIKEFYGIEMPIRTVGEYLKRWGFTPQRPLNSIFKFSERTKRVGGVVAESGDKLRIQSRPNPSREYRKASYRSLFTILEALLQ